MDLLHLIIICPASLFLVFKLNMWKSEANNKIFFPGKVDVINSSLILPNN